MAVTRWQGDLLCGYCSRSNLIKCFFILVVIVAGTMEVYFYLHAETVVLYNGRYGASARAHELDTHSSFNGGQQSYANAKPESGFDQRAQRKVNQIVQKLNHSQKDTRIRDSDWLVGARETGQDVGSGGVPNSKTTPSGNQDRSSSDLDKQMEEKRHFSKSFKPSSAYVPTVQYRKKSPTVRPPVEVNTPHSVVDHSATTTCNQSCHWWREQDSRQRRVKETCSALQSSRISPALNFNISPQTLHSLSHLIVLDSHKLIYCYIPKVGCTNWKRILLVAKGVYPSAKEIGQKMTHVATDKHMRLLSSYPIAEAKRILHDYQTFMFVRHPFERVVSAYIDKFEMDYPSSTKFRRETGPSILRYADEAFRKNPRKMKDGTLNVTFQQFVRFVGDPKNRDLEPHWAEMYSQCHPCMVHYDILGNYSTLIEDANEVIKTARLNQEYPTSTNPTGSSERMLQYFAQLKPEEIKQLHKRYATDFRLFGYSIPDGINL